MGDIKANDIKIFSEILKRSQVTDAKLQALEFLLGLTGSTEGLDTLYKNGTIIFATLLELTLHSVPEIAEKASAILINVSAEEHGTHLLMSVRLPDSVSPRNNVSKSSAHGSIVCMLLEHIFNSNSLVTNEACMIAANLSRKEDLARRIYETCEDAGDVVQNLTELSLKTDEKYNYVVSLLSNLSQLEEIRKILLESSEGTFQKLLPLIEYKNSAIRRNGVVGIIRNLCLSVENHEKLLNPEIDVLPRLLLPLAGPEEFDDEDNEKLPLDLQYLPSDKTRESDPSLRNMLLEILMQLSATRFGRDVMRKYNVYVILRELHKWETDARCTATCEDFVNILIRTEEEIGADNLQAIDIPADLIQKFNKME